jgi:hypothetical protein
MTGIIKTLTEKGFGFIAREGAAMSIAAFNSKINITFPSCVWFVTAHFISNYHEKVDGTIPWDMVG